MRRTLALALTTLFKFAMHRVNLVRFALLIFTLICVLQQMGCRSLLERESYANPAKERTRPVKITKEWKAENTSVRLETRLSLIEDKKTWEILWDACAEGQTPTVNFDRYMILAVRGVAPNQLTVRRVSLNQKNELLVDSMTTFMASLNFCYVFLQIPKIRVEGAKEETVARLALTSSSMLVRTKETIGDVIE
jgi:hypothetical protein